MLYRIGLLIFLASAAFVGESVFVPAAVAVFGLGLMTIGRRLGNG